MREEQLASRTTLFGRPDKDLQFNMSLPVGAALLTGDDTGLVKWVRTRDMAVVRRFGTQSFRSSVTHVGLAPFWTTDEESSGPRLVVAHEDASLRVYDVESARMVAHSALHAPLVHLQICAPDSSSSVPVHPSSSATASRGQSRERDRSPHVRILTGHNDGKLCIRSLSELISDSKKQDDSSVQLGCHLTCMRAFPAVSASMSPPTHIIAAGKENLMHLYDICQQRTIWRAKNVRCDHLQLRQSVDPVDVAFVSAWCLVEGCATRRFHYYDTRAQRMPLYSLKTGDNHAITSIDALNESFVLIANTAGKVCLYDLRKRMRVGGYKGGTQGSVRKVLALPPPASSHHVALVKQQYMATASMDRFVRIFNVQSRTFISKTYLKQKLTTLLWVSSEEGAFSPELFESKKISEIDKKPDMDTIKIEHEQRHVNSKFELQDAVNETVNDDDENEMWKVLEARRLHVNEHLPLSRLTDEHAGYAEISNHLSAGRLVLGKRKSYAEHSK